MVPQNATVPSMPLGHSMPEYFILLIFISIPTSAASFPAFSFREHGENVFAVSHLATQQELDQIQTKLKKNFILCNNTLLEILFKSGLHIPLDQALANQRAATSLVRPYHMLVDEEQAVIQHASALVQEVDKKFSAGMVDVVDTREIKVW